MEGWKGNNWESSLQGVPSVGGDSRVDIRWGEKKEERPREYIHTRMAVHEDERGNKGKVKMIESLVPASTK